MWSASERPFRHEMLEWEGKTEPCYITISSEVHIVAKKVDKVVKLQIPAGKANPAPPVGPALGQAGV